MIVLAILATVAGIGLTRYQSSIKIARGSVVEKELRDIHAEIWFYEQRVGSLPATLDDLGMGPLVDPWGNPYQYLSFDGIKGKGKKRKDRFVVPINTYFDLYSMGPDGKSAIPLTAKASRDDIIVANDGDYVGPARNY
jgi:general secretion pathway protein G